MTDQQHPLHSRDRQTVDNLLQADASDLNLAELARLRIRYLNFPGARDIQTDLDKILHQWGLTEEELYQKTRQIHANSRIFQVRSNKREEEDWS
jgi:Protein of unknown function (DUF3288)